MSKVLCVGDPHFSCKQPRNRLDDILNTQVKKIESLGKLVIDNQVSDVLFLGDLFNSKGLDFKRFVSIASKLMEIKMQTGVRFHTICGNHDMLNRDPESINYGPIGFLVSMGVLEPIRDEFDIDDVHFISGHYYVPVGALKPATKGFNVLLGHYFYNSGFGGEEDVNLLSTDIKRLNYNYIFLGHDHAQYEPLKIHGTMLYRPGSLTRLSLSRDQIRRDHIYVYLMDTDSKGVELLSVPEIQPVNVVFNMDQKVIDSIGDNHIGLADLEIDFSDLLSGLEFNQTSDLMNILNELNFDEEVKNRLLEYLRLGGLA